MSKLHRIADDDLEVYAIGEDAPQIVGVFDERPPELIAKEDYKNNGKWKVIADVDGFTSSLNIHQTDLDDKVRGTAGNNSTTGIKKRLTNPKPSRFTDVSPQRRRRSGSDNSPPRKRFGTDGDLSPPRTKQAYRKKAQERNGEPRSSRFTDASPPQRLRRSSSDNSSPSRRKIKREPDSDASPPRRKIKREPDSDASPPRRKIERESDSDASPRRLRSPDRGHAKSDKNSYNRSKRTPPRYSSRTPKMSPSHQRRDRSSSSVATNPKMVKTLDGKTAGLQNAKALRVENDKFKRREEESFNKMSSDLSGRHAEAVVRDRKTGRIRDLGEEAAKEHEKLLKEQERKAIYDKWGKG